MSYSYRGRYTHSHSEYQRWVAEGEAADMRSGNESLQRAANDALREARAARQQTARDVRELARRQTSVEERQRQYETIVQRIGKNQEDYERRNERRRQELERDLRGEIGAAEERVQEEIRRVDEINQRRITDVRKEVQHVREDLQAGLTAVRAEVRQVQRQLDMRIDEVRNELEAEKQRRTQLETDRASEARAISDWVSDRMQSLADLDSLGLTIERTRTQQNLDRVREKLAGNDRGMAVPVAESAFTSFQTAYFESERRLGVIDGAADHINSVAAEIEKMIGDASFQAVFGPEQTNIQTSLDELRQRAASWKQRRHWHSFESERSAIIDRANRLLAITAELSGSVPAIVQKLTERDERARQVAGLIESVAGAVDSFEVGYASEKDPKSPRRLRARVGGAHIDVYLDMDGTYSVDAYGFSSTTSCAAMADAMGARLDEVFHVAERKVDESNPSRPSIAIPAPAESWTTRSAELDRIRQTLTAH